MRLACISVSVSTRSLSFCHHENFILFISFPIFSLIYHFCLHVSNPSNNYLACLGDWSYKPSLSLSTH
jgi:hypothetical protein